jgi:putative transposase
MYDYRKATPAEREAMLTMRRDKHWPWHAPPHFDAGRELYLLTAACYEHQGVLASETRRDEWAASLFTAMEEAGGILRAWVVLPNHYHLVACVSLDAFAARIGRLHNGKATQWNREDAKPGRKVWHRFSDRRIRSQGHYFTTLNYVHGNPVHHGYADRPCDWRWSSVGQYAADVGSAVLDKWSRDYPVDQYGKGWDDL